MKKSKKQKKEIYCPYCGAKAKLMTFKDVYGTDAYMSDEKIWVCSNFNKGCDAYVRTHHGTEKPFGQLANAKLRRLRIEAHWAINEVIDAGIMDKHSIYDYLEISLGYQAGRFHLGNSGEYHCKKVIEIMNEILSRKDKRNGKNGRTEPNRQYGIH